MVYDLFTSAVYGFYYDTHIPIMCPCYYCTEILFQCNLKTWIPIYQVVHMVECSKFCQMYSIIVCIQYHILYRLQKSKSLHRHHWDKLYL